MRFPTMLAIALAALPPEAMAQDTVARDLAASCAQCHGTAGRSVSSEVTALAGLRREFIVQRMREFRDGRRRATVMHQLAKGYTDRQIDLLAGYFAAQKQKK